MRTRTSSDQRLGEPQTNRDVFRLLGRAGVLTVDLAGRLELMAGFRNVVVRMYGDVSLAIVRDVVMNRVGDLLEFVAAIRVRLWSLGRRPHSGRGSHLLPQP